MQLSSVSPYMLFDNAVHVWPGVDTEGAFGTGAGIGAGVASMDVDVEVEADMVGDVGVDVQRQRFH